MAKRQLQWAITIFVGIVIIIGGGSLFVRHVVGPQFRRLPFVSNNQVVPFHEHHGLDPEIPTLISGPGINLNDVPQPFIEDEVIYLPASFLVRHFDPFLFWDSGAGVLTITTREDIVVFHLGRTRFYVNGMPREMDNPIRLADGEVFIPAGIAEALYPVIVRHYEAYNLVVAESAALPRTTAELTQRTDIRFREISSSPIAVRRAPAGSVVTVFEEIEGFTRVRTEDGILGWAPTSSIGETTTVSPINTLVRETLLGGFILNTITLPPNWPAGKPVIMAWDSISGQAVNYARMQVPLYDSLNVVAPTWFGLNTETMNLTSLACREYAGWANASEVQVWPTFEIPAGNVRAFLTNRAARQRVIGQLVGYVDELSLGGINIDFAPHSYMEGPYFIQFLRELAPPLRARGAVLTVNAMDHESAFYERGLIAYTVDFVIIMALDEHNRDSDISGPVASLSFVRNNIEAMLEYIPREQLVLALPFYNRVWRELIVDNTPETRRILHFGTGYTREWFDYHDVEWEWLPDIGSYFGGFSVLEGDEMVWYSVWLECARSLDEKLLLFQRYNLAGVAAWDRSFRYNEELWEVKGRNFPQ